MNILDIHTWESRMLANPQHIVYHSINTNYSLIMFDAFVHRAF